MSVTYFIVYRYQTHRSGETVDGNTVMTFDDVITTEREIRGIETLIAQGKGVDPPLLGITNLVRLE